ncbi:MAG: hypothetical protein JJW01_02715, partial [Alphaproteobacteria bacterium]|nr:hypothetical protein [Rickettsiales bacterium]
MALRVFGPTLGRFSRVGFRSKTRRIGITDSVLLQLNIVNKLLAEQKKASIGDPFAGDSEFETLITKQINIPKNVETSGLPDIYHSTAKKSNTDNTKNISVNPNNTSENFQTTHNKALQYKKEESVNNVQNLKNITSSVNKVSHLQPLINKKSEVNFNDNTQEETTINNQVNNVSNNIEEVSNNITSDRQEAVQGVINNTQEQEESMHSKRNIVNVVEENVVEENVVEENVVEENVVEENVVE